MDYNIITDGLVAKWSKEGWSSGTSWVDDIGGKVITLTSEPSKSSDGIELTSSITFASESLASLGLSNSCTIEWLGRIDGAFNNNSPGHVFGISATLKSWSGICCYSKTSTSGVQLDIGSGGTIKSGIYTVGAEYHIVVTVNDKTSTAYVNKTTATGSTTNSNGYASKTYLYNNEGNGRFSGAINRMCLWNRPLSADEIVTLFTEKTSSGIYVRRQGAWQEATTAYQKQNGVWQEIEASTAKEVLRASNVHSIIT